MLLQKYRVVKLPEINIGTSGAGERTYHLRFCTVDTERVKAPAWMKGNHCQGFGVDEDDFACFYTAASYYCFDVSASIFAVSHLYTCVEKWLRLLHWLMMITTMGRNDLVHNEQLP